MEEVNPIPANNLDEKPIDILKRLIVRLKRFNKLRGGIEELLW